jgi:hypothetical protein
MFEMTPLLRRLALPGVEYDHGGGSGSRRAEKIDRTALLRD